MGLLGVGGCSDDGRSCLLELDCVAAHVLAHPSLTWTVWRIPYVSWTVWRFPYLEVIEDVVDPERSRTFEPEGCSRRGPPWISHQDGWEVDSPVVAEEDSSAHGTNDFDVDVDASGEDRMNVGTTQADADAEASGADAEDTAEREELQFSRRQQLCERRR